LNTNACPSFGQDFFVRRNLPGAAIEQRNIGLGTKIAKYFEDIALASRIELSEFLVAVERRAYKQARFAVRDEQAALDIVQDSMLKLSEKYGAKPVAELPMLFQRILQNTIRDYYRRFKVRATWMTQLSSIFSGKDGAEDADPLETLGPAEDSNQALGPPDHLEKSQLIVLIETELKELPPRQREAFLLRYWEELDVAETAQAMGCSEGSVKTHCSRAAHTLATALKRKGVTL
jgi:RNA polymerase sigma-70 factor, ECF subfamily